MTDISAVTDRELLVLYGSVMKELRDRKLVRSSNGPAADIAEGIAARALSLTLQTASTTGYDGVDPAGKKYEVKCRRLTAHNKSRQLSAIRNLDNQHFDYLVGVLFNEDFSVLKGALIPFSVVKERATFVKHTNGWKFLLRDSVWTLPGVEDITEKLRAVQH